MSAPGGPGVELIRERELSADARTATRGRLDGQLPTEQQPTFVQAREAARQPPAEHRLSVKALARIDDLHDERMVTRPHPHRGFTYTRVTGNVGEGLLDDAVGGGLQIRRETAV